MIIKLNRIVLILTLVLINVGITAEGQTKNIYSISGQLIDSTSSLPIEYASVAVYKSIDSTLVSGAITNVKGEFLINNLPQGKLFIKSSYIGYNTRITNVEITKSSIILSEPILMNSLWFILTRFR